MTQCRAKCRPVSSPSSSLAAQTIRLTIWRASASLPRASSLSQTERYCLASSAYPSEVAFRLGQQRPRFQPPQVQCRNARPTVLPVINDSVRLGEVVGGSALDEKADQCLTGATNKIREPPVM